MSEKTKVYEEKMQKSVEAYSAELSTIRAGRANPHVLDKITVDYFGTETPLNQVGNVTVPEARLLQIQPWDAGMLKKIEKAIQMSDLGINPTNDGKVIRLVFPELTEERRKSLTKDVKKKAEDFKVAVRNIRRDAVDAFKKMEKKSEITEDELEDLDELIQKATDKHVEEIEKVMEAKNKEIMSI
ncbi:MAG: ribosome recycling factor [Firmicutes bacterium]|nr:ribosome recycling factor [Bacillota bacterium]